MDELRERRRIVRVLAAHAGMTNADLAELWGVERRTVRSYLAPNGLQYPSAEQVELTKQHVKKLEQAGKE